MDNSALESVPNRSLFGRCSNHSRCVNGDCSHTSNSNNSNSNKIRWKIQIDMDIIRNLFTSGTAGTTWIQTGVVVVGGIVALVSFALLIPLDSVPAVTGVSIIIGISYSISAILWLIVMNLYGKEPNNLIWINTSLMFLVVLPATIGATAMNVTAIQNTRNLLAGQITN